MATICLFKMKYVLGLHRVNLQRYQILRLNLDVQSIKPGTILFKISVKAGILFISEFRLGMISVYFRFHYRQESCLVQSSV